jgi:hypothetical protein
MRALLSVLAIGAVHFIAARAWVAAAAALGMPTAADDHMPTFLTHVFVGVTKVLYFPVISLSLYSRQWFPGPWIVLPMAVNSLLWGLAIYGLWRLARRRAPEG